MTTYVYPLIGKKTPVSAISRDDVLKVLKQNVSAELGKDSRLVRPGGELWTVKD